PLPWQRFASVPRFVELLVVADETMVRFHGEGLRPYLLTVLATAARAFGHGSLANAVELRVKRLLVLGEGAPGPPRTPNAAQMLRSFCQWQRGLNDPDEDSPQHFDTAILFTRQVGGLGGSPGGDIGGWKGPGGVSMGRWKGPGGLWHVFNMLHDTSPPCRQLNGHHGATRRVMAPVLAALDPGEMWSPCSARFITDFLDNGHG
ncbi:ATS4 metalloproteinase, partial [Piaya cayana]|nr:ATS4 metalloproteinase [Piaya cayana]